MLGGQSRIGIMDIIIFHVDVTQYHLIDIIICTLLYRIVPTIHNVFVPTRTVTMNVMPVLFIRTAQVVILQNAIIVQIIHTQNKKALKVKTIVFRLHASLQIMQLDTGYRQMLIIQYPISI